MPDLFFGKQKDRDSRFIDNPETSAVQTPPQQEQDAPSQPPLSNIQKIKNKVHKMNLFTAFAENPDNITFENQEPDEKILIFLRKSNFINLPWIITALVLLAVPFVAYSLRGLYTQLLPPLPFITVLVAMYYLMVITYAFVHFLTWYYNAALITSERVVDIDFHQLVLKEVGETKLSLVEDVSYRQDGVFENIFDFGYVLIQTAGTIDNFEFHDLPKPERIMQVVESLIGRKR